MDLSRFTNQTATLWTTGSLDAYGNTSFNAPITLACRWEDEIKLVKDKNGNQVVANAIVYLLQDVSTGDYLYNGSSSSSTPLPDAYEVIRFSKIPSIDGKTFERIAYVG